MNRAGLVVADMVLEQLAAAERTLTEARGKRDSVEGRLEEVRKRRAVIEERIAGLGERSPAR